MNCGKPMEENEFESKRSGAIDMLTGAPWKRLLLFAVPLFIGNIFQQLYNTVDSIIVGRYISHIALAAVGVSTRDIQDRYSGSFSTSVAVD